jgi:hypothetical protein
MLIKKLTLVLVAVCVLAVGCKQDATVEFTIETMALTAGYDLRNDFAWTETADQYFTAIMQGKVSLDAAKAAEGYLRTITHPLIANRLVSLAGMVGFDLNEYNQVIGVEHVNIKLLQVAAQGFRMGLLLDGPVSSAVPDDSNITLTPWYGQLPVMDSSEFHARIKEAVRQAAEETNRHFGIDRDNPEAWLQANGFMLTDEEVKAITPGY